MGKGSKIMGMFKKQQKSKEKELMERAARFQKDYREVSSKHGIDFVAELQFTPNGIMPVLRIREVEAPPMKPWSEAKAENLEIRKKCEHENDGDKPNCKKCGVAKEYWGEGGKGLKPEYVERELAAIEEIKKQEGDNAEEEVAEAVK